MFRCSFHADVRKGMRKRSADEFEYLWRYPQCVGAIDGKHTIVQTQWLSAFQLQNTYSIVLWVVAYT